MTTEQELIRRVQDEEDAGDFRSADRARAELKAYYASEHDRPVCECTCGCTNLRTIEDRGGRCRQCVLGAHLTVRRIIDLTTPMRSEIQ